MNIIELKSAWSLLEQEIIGKDSVEKSEIMRSVHSKSKSEIAKIKKSLQMKFFLASISFVFAAGLAIFSYLKPSLNPLDFILSTIESVSFFGIMALSIGVVAYFNFLAYSQIEAIEKSALNLKENLQFFIDAMKKAIAFNIYSDTIIAPVIFTWVYYAYTFSDYPIGTNGRTLLLFMFPFVVGVCSYLFGRFIQQLKFGRYMDRLSGYLKSLQKNEAEL